MVDFNNEVTVTRSQKEIVAFQILEARYNVLESIELYYKQKSQNMIPISKPAVHARIINLFLNMKSSMKSDYKNKDDKKGDLTLYKETKIKVHSENIDLNLEAFEELDNFLYDSGITKYYSKRDYNSYNTWEEDEAKGI